MAGYDVIVQGKEVLTLRVRTVINLVEVEKDALVEELAHVAKEIRQLREVLNYINSNDDALSHDRAVIRLDAAERDYFLLYNNHRVVSGYEPVKGDKFGGEHSYESFLF